MNLIAPLLPPANIVLDQDITRWVDEQEGTPPCKSPPSDALGQPA